MLSCMKLADFLTFAWRLPLLNLEPNQTSQKKEINKVKKLLLGLSTLVRLFLCIDESNNRIQQNPTLHAVESISIKEVIEKYKE